ncbi:MAG TPA: hypothetical protein VFL86_05480 [Burkholderiaceae bacterium]|nr:hypothetical protein [Burkholderiaceae bacterium]
MQVCAITRREWLAALGALSLGLNRPLRAAAADGAAIDLMPNFWHTYDAGRALQMPERAEGLRREFFEPHADTYRQAGSKLPDDAAIGRWLASFDGIAPSVRDMHHRFAHELARHSAAFRIALPDFDPQRSPIYLLPSMDRFDAHLEPHANGLPLFFAPDGIVRYHGAGADLSVLFTHEIFHCYQGQMNPGMTQDTRAPVYVNLWVEGGATYASERLNPQASLHHVLLDDDVLLREGPGTATRVAKALLDRIDATDDATLNSFFSMGWRGPWPARAGYYVGLLVARDWARTMDLQALAAMPRERVREQSIAALQRIALGRAP